MILSHSHRFELETDSAISPDIIIERGYQTISDPADLPDVFEDYQRRTGLLIPIQDVTGEIASWQLKADDPRISKKGKPLRYDSAARGRQCVDVPVRSRPHLGDPAVSLWVTEGAKKCDAGLSHGIPCIVGLQGVYGWRGTNEHGGKTALPDWESIALNGRDVILAFDSDCMTKPQVRDALDRLSAFLKQRGAKVRYLLMPDLPDGAKCGLDDWFVSGGSL